MHGEIEHWYFVLEKRDNEMERHKVIVSIVIPTYNRAEQLMNAIFSVQRQTVDNVEILVCDDGSSDGTREKVEEESKKDSRIIYIDCGHNGRPAIPRNIGISRSHGEWLAFLDDDDIWNPVKLEVQLHELKLHNVKACCTNAFCYENDRNTGKTYFEGLTDREYSFRHLIRVNPIINSSMILHRSLIDKCGGYPEEEKYRAIEDYAFWYKVIGYTKILYIDVPLVGYLVTSPSSIRLDNSLTFDEQKSIIEQGHRDWLDGKDDRIKNYYRYERYLFKFVSLTSVVTKSVERMKRCIEKTIGKIRK